MIDFHFHDDASSDGTGPLPEHCRAAAAADLREVCVTNHVEVLGPEGSWTVNVEEAVARFRRERAAADEARKRWPDLTVRVGAEFEYRPEWTAALDRLAAEVPLDFIIGSVHVVEGENISGGPGAGGFFEPRSLREAYGAYFNVLEEMVEWGGFDVVGHFDLIKRFGHRHYGRYDPSDFEGPIRTVLDTMAGAGIGLEINTSGLFQAPESCYPAAEILVWGREAGVRVLTLGSDAHAPGQLGRGLAAGADLARRAGWEHLTLFDDRQRRRVALEEVLRFLAPARGKPAVPVDRDANTASSPRTATVERETAETRVRVRADLDGAGRARVATGIGFFDHMLALLAGHSLIDLDISAEGDLEVDEHHTVEDVGIVLGQALSGALGERRGIRRYGFLLPMDETLARVAVDLGGRSYLVLRAEFERPTVGGFPTELVEDFLRALADHLKATLHVSLEYGRNEHHKIEAIFKALGRALRAAVERDPRRGAELPTTKQRIET